MNKEIFKKKISDTESEIAEEIKHCFFCNKLATGVRRFTVDEDSGCGEHNLCWLHTNEFDEREGIFDPFQFLE